jgi:hypothetical protein
MNCSGEKATHGKKGGQKMFCKTCAQGMEGVGNISTKCCRNDECFSEPNYNFFGLKPGVYCTKHKEPGMEDVKHPHCQHVGENSERCTKNPTFGPVGGEKATYCEPHSRLYEGMTRIRGGLCHHVSDEDGECKSRAAWNTEGNKTGKWCREHRTPEDVYVLKIYSCKEDGCDTRSSYNFPHLQTPIYCELHKKQGMENVVDPKCCVEGCNTIASFGRIGTKEKTHCAPHRQEGMHRTRGKKCEHPGCEKEPSQNSVGETKRRFCKDHCEEDMVNVKSKKCKQCKTREAFYNYRGTKQRLYCYDCRKVDMVDLSAKYCQNSYELNGKTYYCNTRTKG